MGNLADIVTVAISTSGAQPSQPGFGVPMIVGQHTRFTELFRSYADTDAMVSDGFATTDPEYKAAAKLIAQNPRVPRFMIGRRALPSTPVVDITPVALNSRVYRIKVQGTVYSITSGSSATVAAIVTALAAAIGSVAGLTVTDNTTKLTLAVASGKYLEVEIDDSPETVGVAGMALLWTHADPGIATDLAAIRLANNSWYGLTLAGSIGLNEAVAAAAWAETNKKLFVQQQNDTATITHVLSGATDGAAVIKAASDFRTLVLYHAKMSEFADAALLGARLPTDPGGEDWKFVQLAGVTADILSDTAITNLKAKNCGYFTDFGGVAITAEGITAGGEYVDVIRGRDWYESELQVGVYRVMLAASAAGKKVPFTDGGIAQIEGVIVATNQKAVKRGFLAASPAPTISAPLASEVSANDKATRTLTGMKFAATLAGAIHAVSLKGVFTP